MGNHIHNTTGNYRRVVELVKSGKLKATTDFSAAAAMDTINICVPTPLRKTKDPDMSYIVNACQEIAKYFHPGVLVILESTTYPGTTNELDVADRHGEPGRDHRPSCRTGGDDRG